MKKVYVVTSGEYSDYCIEAIFSDLEKALELKLKAGFDNEIELFEIDTPISNFVYIVVTMKKNGDIISTEQFLSTNYLGGFSQYDPNGELVWVVKTDDEKRAIKVTNEKRSQILAADSWGSFAKTIQLFEKRND